MIENFVIISSVEQACSRMGGNLFTGIKKGKRNKNQYRNHWSGNRPNGLCAVWIDGGGDGDCRGIINWNPSWDML